MTGHTPKLSVRSCASLPPHAGLLVMCFFLFGCCCPSDPSDPTVLCECPLSKRAKDGVWTVGTVYASDGINLRREA